MNFAPSVTTCFQKYATFQGRAARSEFWYFTLFQLTAFIVGWILGAILGVKNAIDALIWLALLLPSISVAVRRLHDINRSGWSYWVTFIPLVGPIVMLVWFCQRGTLGPNDYGDDSLAF
jgi:uncharacterized membrane protein YhaH (DUF805 family)